MSPDLVSIADLSADDFYGVLDLADDLKARVKKGEPHRLLEGKTIAMIFEKPSLRTRVTFAAGVFHLGGLAILLQERLGKRETIPDVARNLDRWVNGIVARTHSHRAVEQLAEYASVPVINALTDDEHPCQILADAQTLREHKGKLEGLKIAFVGDGNNVFASWALLGTLIPFDLTLVCPGGFECDSAIRQRAERGAKGNLIVTNDVAGVAGADMVYTDVWTSMGQEDEYDDRIQAFQAYQVNEKLMARAKSDAVFMHCLPAHRGEEVTDGVIESRQSVVFDQAENRLHAQKAVMVLLMGGGH